MRRLNFNGSIQSPFKNPPNLHLHKRQKSDTDGWSGFFSSPRSKQASLTWNCSSHLPSFERERFDRFARLRAVSLLLQNSREKFDTGVSCSKMGVWCHWYELSKGFRNAVWKQGSLSFRSSLALPRYSRLAARPPRILEQKRDCSQSNSERLSRREIQV